NGREGQSAACADIPLEGPAAHVRLTPADARRRVGYDPRPARTHDDAHDGAIRAHRTGVTYMTPSSASHEPAPQPAPASARTRNQCAWRQPTARLAARRRSVPGGIRTHVLGVKGRRPRP